MSHIDIYTKAFKGFKLISIQGDLQCSLLLESLVTYYCTCRYYGSVWPQWKYVIMCIGSKISKFQHLISHIMYILGIFACTQSGYHAGEDVEKGGDHSLEDLAKSGYKTNIKYESLIILLYISYMLQSK